MNFEYIKMPKTEDGFAEVFHELQPFLAGMYSEQDIELHGPENFYMEQWIFLWDMGHAGLLVSRNDDGTPRGVAQCLKSRDLWYSKERMDIYRYAFDIKITEPKKELEAMAEYLIGVSSLMNFDELYITKRSYEGELRGVEIKELRWHSQGHR